MDIFRTCPLYGKSKGFHDLIGFTPAVLIMKSVYHFIEILILKTQCSLQIVQPVSVFEQYPNFYDLGFLSQTAAMNRSDCICDGFIRSTNTRKTWQLICVHVSPILRFSLFWFLSSLAGRQFLLS